MNFSKQRKAGQVIVRDGVPGQMNSANCIILVGVNYASYEYAANFVTQWSSIDSVKQIILVDNFSTEEERRKVRDLGKHDSVTLVELPNVGYGSALNTALQYISDNLDASGSIILFGNVDVEPVKIGPIETPPGTIPQIIVWERRRNRNPFMTSCQASLLRFYILAAKRRSKALLKACIVLNRILAWVPCRTWAVHGSFFAVPGNIVHAFRGTFSEEVFLYCEELFFALRVMSLELRFVESDIAVRHVGGVSTGPAIRSNSDEFFDNWCHSMQIFSRVAREQDRAAE